MTVVYDGTFEIADGTIIVASDEESAEILADIGEAFRGQTNGMIGAQVPGALVLMTGIQHGPVKFKIEYSDAEPPLDPSWEDVAEVTFTPSGPVTNFSNLDDIELLNVPFEQQSYRVRWCGKDIDAAQQVGMADDGRAIDSYALYLWPAPPAGEVVVKRTSENARLMAEQWNS